MTSSYFKFDYDLNSLKKIDIHNFQMWITPRYLPHYKDNAYESFSTEVVNNYLKDNSVFVDVGAHYGYYSVLASKAKKNVEVVSIEPVEENFKILEKNIKLNNVEKSTIYNMAISDKNSIREFNVTEASDSAGFYNHPLTKSKKKIQVKTRSLDSLLKNKKVDFIKIDVEGHEISVLSGMKKTISDNKKLKILIEFNPKILENAGFKPEDLITKIEGYGFEVYLIDETKRRYYRLTNNINSWDKIVNIKNYDSFYANLLCIKKEESLFTTFFSHTSGLEGAERSLLQILEKLPTHGAISHLICPNNGQLIEELKNKAVSTDIVPYTWWASTKDETEKIDLKYSLTSMGRFLKTMEKMNPHLIYTNTSVIPWGALSALLLNKPHIWHIHEFGDKDHQLEYSTSLEEARFIIDKLSDKIIYNSEAVKKYHSKLKFSKKNIVINGGIELENIIESEITKIYKKDKSLKLILVGSFRESKGQDQAIEAVAHLSKSGIETELLLLGRYDIRDVYYKKLRELINKNKLKNVYFKKFVKNPYPYIMQADALLMCSKKEAFGRVTIEGMLLKKLVLGSKSGATTKIITDGKTGLLYEEGNVGDLAKKIKFIINNRKKMKLIAENGYEEALKKYSVRKYIKNIYGVLINQKSKEKNDFSITSSLGVDILQSFFKDYSSLEINDESERIESSRSFKLWKKYWYYKEKFSKYIKSK